MNHFDSRGGGLVVKPMLSQLLFFPQDFYFMILSNKNNIVKTPICPE